MAEISSLGIRIDSSDAKNAAADLDRLSATGAKTESAIGRLVRSAKEFGQGLRSGAREGLREYSAGTAGISAASRSAAVDIGRVTHAAKAQHAVMDTAGRAIRRYALLLVSAFSVREIIQSADAYTNLSARLLLATGSSEKFSKAQAELADIAFRTRSTLAGTTDLFAKLTQATGELGVSQTEVLAVTESINKAMALSGTGAQAASAALIQLSQAFGSGQLRGEELRSVMENSLRLSQAIADGMGIAVGRLRGVAEEGKLTAEVVFKALQKSAGQVDREFAKLPITVGGATTQVKSALLELIGEFNNSSGAGGVLAGVISDVALWIRDLTKWVKEMARNGELQRWIDDASDGFHNLIEFVKLSIASFQDLMRAATALSGSFSAVFADLKVASAASKNMFGGVFFEENRKAFAEALEERNRTVAESNRKLTAFINGDSALSAAIEKLNLVDIGDTNRRRRAALVEEPPIEDEAPKRKKGSTPLTPEQMRAAAQLRKALMDAEVQTVRRGMQELTSAYGAAEAILDAQRSAGLLSEADYYSKKRGFIVMNADAQAEAIEQENRLLAAQKANGAEKVKIQQKIADNEAKVREIRLKATSELQVLEIEQVEANKNVVRSFEEARQAAQAYLDTLVQAQRREVEGMGRGQRSRDQDAGRAQIDDRYQSQRLELENNRALLEMEGKFTPESQRQYNERLRIINEFHQKARDSYDDFWKYRSDREGDWLLGAQEGFANYLDGARNIYQQTADAVENAMKGMEDALVEFVTKGKADFRSLADAILADILRIQIRAAILGIFPGLGKAAPVTASQPTTVIPGRASGGSVLAGGMYRVLEEGPELLEMGGRNYLMMGSRSGNVVPNHQLGGGVTIHQTLNVGAGASRSELAAAMVIAKEEVKREIYESMRNGGVFA